MAGKYGHLQLAVKRSTWRQAGQFESTRPEWRRIREGILQRDNYTCVFCQWMGESYQEVHHLDGDHDNHHESNLVTACHECHLTQHLGLAGLLKKGSLIFCPELSQETLNWLIRWVNVGPYSSNELNKLASTIKVSRPFEDLVIFFDHRRALCKSLIGSDNPSDLANLMLNMSDEDYDQRMNSRFSQVRFLPNFEKFSEEYKKFLQGKLYTMVPGIIDINGFLLAGEAPV